MMWSNSFTAFTWKTLSSFGLCNLILMFLYQYRKALLSWGFGLVKKQCLAYAKPQVLAPALQTKTTKVFISYTCLHLKGVSLLGTGLFSKDTASSSQRVLMVDVC